MKTLRFALFTAAATLCGFIGGAYAQVTANAVPTVHQGDLVPVVPNGQPSAQGQYANPAQISGAPGYVNLGVATTGNSYTFAKAQTNMFMQPAATLAAVTLVTEPNPSDGQRECFLSTQTTTALTWTANTGQTMGSTITAGVANTPLCIEYQLSAATWYRAP